MFTTRLISGIILVLLSIVIVGQGGILLYAVTALISIIGLFELYRALGMQRRSLAVVGYVTNCSLESSAIFSTSKPQRKLP